jgi:hypothetical protein
MDLALIVLLNPMFLALLCAGLNYGTTRAKHNTKATFVNIVAINCALL